jgi:hypothetical protein
MELEDKGKYSDVDQQADPMSCSQLDDHDQQTNEYDYTVNNG